MSLHRLTAGSGYDYLTGQVAAMDSTEKGHTGLASYYSEKGEAPGRWTGSGLAGIDGLDAGDPVTAEQMRALFGSGHHPLAPERAAALAARGATAHEIEEAARLGAPFKVFAGDVSPFRVEIAHRLEALNRARGLPAGAPVGVEGRARIRSKVALERFLADFGRPPLDARELAGHLARLSRQRTTAVAGFDLTFSPVKSVSALWALADAAVAARIERAHNAAVADALRFIERHALFTRTGTNGVRQVDVRGLVATAFTHRDSRAGDPDLHTHVAVANKVQTVEDGRWLSIDSRVLHKAVVAASETYNTSLERHLAADLGLEFAERGDDGGGKRPVREVVGVDARLNGRWSSRRRSIDTRRRQLARGFQAAHGRPPTPVEAIALAQQATLETRDAKHEPRTRADQRAAWRAQAAQVLGGAWGIRLMLHTALHPNVRPATHLSDAWFGDAARGIVAAMERTRSGWQTWHVHAQALREVRSARVPLDLVDPVVDRLIREALALSVPIGTAEDGVSEPAPLRRSDGRSVYTVSGSQLYTSRRILDAEQFLVAAAGRRDGRVIPDAAVEVALFEAASDGLALNAGQVVLVREMATSGARLQLALAPAGSGKTAAMSALARAWVHGGGQVLGLAPSATAAAGLADQIGARAETLAKVASCLDTGDLPDWLASIGPRTVVVIDEAGMADTLSLQRVVGHVIGSGGSVRLIGDDQQLAAIGAGGVLRDIAASHGALRLSELVRFTDPAEGSASLALRDGAAVALGFYLDNNRIHVGDEATVADDLFAGYLRDHTAGLDTVMLAPTRDLVAELNQRARRHRLAGTDPERSIELSDGNLASVGDTIITRHNNRSLRLSATDFVKNGDRWTVRNLDRGRGILARHTRTGRTIILPPAYVAAWVELGYASTTHTAQGITADTMHGLLTGDESRQQAYTMLTRGRLANHAYLIVVGDGERHSAIRPETVNPPTATDILEAVLATDESPVSATTSLRQASAPAARLHTAAQRYTDAVGFAAQHVLGADGLAAFERTVEHQLPGITRADAWPALRAQLLLVKANGRDPAQALARACADPVSTAHNPAAVLAWRLDDTRGSTCGGPLPWLPGIPAGLASHPLWGPYLTARHDLVADLANQVRQDASGAATPPAWLPAAALPDTLVADVQVWRAATGVAPSDSRPTGDPQPGWAARYQSRLDNRLRSTGSAPMEEWGAMLHAIWPAILTDAFSPTLATRLSQLTAAEVDAPALVRAAAQEGPLPDDHAAAALWWRIARHLTPAVSQAVDTDHPVAGRWLDQFTATLGDQALPLQASSWWPALVATIERGIQRGWPLSTLLADAARTGSDGHFDTCQAMVWRLSLITDPLPPFADTATPTHEPEHDPPADLWDGYDTTRPEVDMLPHPALLPPDEPGPPPTTISTDPFDTLAIEALVRDAMEPPWPTDAAVHRMLDRADTWRECPVTPDRLKQVNRLAADFYQARLRSSWARGYLADRFGSEFTGTPHLKPGYAPDAWTALTDHLTARGVTHLELIVAGLARIASTGRLIDHFRDRAVFPIVHDGAILGFVGRRKPAYTDADRRGPKYLNTAETPLFHKGAQLFTAGPVSPDMMPVLVEGPMDAIAITMASRHTMAGVAPLGTSLTDDQAAQLHTYGRDPIIATDADHAGRAAAERAYWKLVPYRLQPRYAALPEGSDPAALLEAGRADQLLDALQSARPLAEVLIDQALTELPAPQAALQSLRILTAQPPQEWEAGHQHIAEQLGLPPSITRATLADLVRAWNTDPQAAAASFATASEQPAHPQAKPLRWAPVASPIQRYGLGPRSQAPDVQPPRGGG